MDFFFVKFSDPATATADPTEILETLEAALLYFTTAMPLSLVKGFSCNPRLLKFRVRRDIHCTNKTYFKPCVEIPIIKKKVKTSRTFRF